MPTFKYASEGDGTSPTVANTAAGGPADFTHLRDRSETRIYFEVMDDSGLQPGDLCGDRHGSKQLWMSSDAGQFRWTCVDCGAAL